MCPFQLQCKHSPQSTGTPSGGIVDSRGRPLQESACKSSDLCMCVRVIMQSVEESSEAPD